MYYIEDDHEAIIDPAVFDMVQQEMERRKTGTSRYSGVSIFQVKLSAVNAEGGMGLRSGTPPTSTVKLSTAATTNITMSAVLHRTSWKRK